MTTPIYLDYAAAAPVRPEALEACAASFRRDYANQEALHGAAREVRQTLQHAAAELISLVGADPGEADVWWSDSGTALIAALLRHPQWARGNVVTTAAEHPALTAAVRRLGLPVRTVKLDRGLIDPDHLAGLLDADTVLVAFHQVQSETGIRQNLPALGALVRQYAPQAYFLADTIQAAGKLPLPWRDASLDLALISGCKIGAPGGAAAVCRRRDGRDFTPPLIALRRDEHLVSRPLAGTCLGLTAALRLAVAERDEALARVTALNRSFRAALAADFPAPVRYLRESEAVSPYILHFFLPGYQAAVLVRMLSARGIFLAAGSACSAETNQPSPALLASGVARAEAFSGLRVSFGAGTTGEEVAAAATALRECVRDY